MKRRIGILLSGCGAYDGSDPHEAIMAMLAVQEAGQEIVALAPDEAQFHTVDHTSGDEVPGEERRQLAEGARLVRGRIHPLSEISPKLLDGLIVPGGQGAVKNLMTGFGEVGGQDAVEEVAAFLRGVHDAGGFIAGISLAEFLLASVFGPFPEGRGCLDLAPTEVFVDEGRRLLLTPGWLLASSLSETRKGIENLVSAMIQLMEARGDEP